MAAQDNKKTDEKIEGGNRTPFVDPSTAFDAYDEAKKWFRPYFDPIDEFERLARNRPSPKIAPNLPKITEGTTASLIIKTPKRALQQVPTGVVKSLTDPIWAEIASLYHDRVILQKYNRQGDALQKHWVMSQKTLTWGRAASYTFLTQTDGFVHTDFVIPYVKDLLTEKGKTFGPDSNVICMRSWYQKNELKAIINREKSFEEKDKDYKSDWDLKLLAQFIDAGSSAKPSDVQTAAEREKGGDNGGYEVIHVFQNGIGAENYSIAPRMEGTKKCLRRKINKDPRGHMPFDFEYWDIDNSNPLGRGIVELTGGTQNLMDQKMQMNQFLSSLLQGPPIKVWGNVNKSTLKFAPGAIWDMGTNRQQSDVEPYRVENSAIASFIPDMQFLQAKIYNQAGSQDSSIPANSGNVGQSKTDAGVNQQQAQLNIDDNYVRKQHEAWFSAQAETSINLTFAEKNTDEKILLEGSDLQEILKSPAAKYVDKKTNELTIPFEKIKDVTMRFTVDASSSEVKEDADNADKLRETYQIMLSSPDQETQAAAKKVLKVLIKEIGAEGTDDIFPEETDEMGNPLPQQPQQDPNAIVQQIMPMVQQMIQEAMAQKPQDDPLLKVLDKMSESQRQAVLERNGLQPDGVSAVQQKLDIEADKAALELNKTAHQQTMDMSNAAQTMVSNDPMTQEATPEEMQLVEGMLQMNYSESDIEQAIIMLRQGRPAQEVMSILGGKYA